MKQKRTRDLTEKTENGSERNAPAQRESAFARRRQQKTVRGGERREADGGVHTSGLKLRRRPKAAVVAGVEPRRDREIGGYQEVQCVLPRRWVVDLGVGERHVDGDTFSGGRWFGRWWRTPVGAANSKLKRGSGEWVY